MKSVSTKSSLRQNQHNIKVDEIPVAAIELNVPLKIPGRFLC